MANKLDTLSKQCILGGVLTIIELCIKLCRAIFALIFSGVQDKRGYRNTVIEDYNYRFTRTADYAYDDSDYDERIEKPAQKVCSDSSNVEEHGESFYYIVIVLSILATCITGAMMYGVIKKRKYLIASWILMLIIRAIIPIFYFIFIVDFDFNKLDVSTCYKYFAFLFLVMYPASILLQQLHSEDIEKKKLHDSDEPKTVTIIPHPKFNPYFMEISENKDASEEIVGEK